MGVGGSSWNAKKKKTIRNKQGEGIWEEDWKVWDTGVLGKNNHIDTVK